jgi:hypothetical protein
LTTDHVQSGVSAAADQDGGRLLRQSLKLDAVASGVLGVLLAAAGAVLDELLGIPAEVLVLVGGFLVVYAASLWFLGTRARVSRPAVWVVVVGNLLWAAASIVARGRRLVVADRHGCRGRARPGRRGHGLRRAAAHRPAPIPCGGLRSGRRPGPLPRRGGSTRARRVGSARVNPGIRTDLATALPLLSREHVVLVPRPHPEDDEPEKADQQLTDGADRPLDGQARPCGPAVARRPAADPTADPSRRWRVPAQPW